MAFVRSPWSLSGLESNSTEQDRALTRDIIRVAFKRYRHELRGFVAEYVSVVLVHIPRFAVPCAQATRPRPTTTSARSTTPLLCRMIVTTAALESQMYPMARRSVERGAPNHNTTRAAGSFRLAAGSRTS